MATQGQRFRRKALRRGYKVEEVDEFLDRVEATLAGQPVGEPVTSQDVHDVVFRVRFGGYDEWQVDLHLDRAERQIAEMEEHGGIAPDHDAGPPEPMAPADVYGRMAPPAEPYGPAGGDPYGPAGGDPYGPPGDPYGPPGDPYGRPDRPGPAGRDDRGAPPIPPMPPRPMPAQAGPPASEPYGRYDEPTGVFAGYDGRGGHEDPRDSYDTPRRDFEGARGPGRRGGPAGPGPTGPGGSVGPGGYGGYGGYGSDESFDGFAPGRHGKPEMTTEMRLPDRDPQGRGPVVPPPPPPPPPPMPALPMGGPGAGGPPAAAGGDWQRVDQIRRSFQVRRFGSGYDPDQVDNLFEQILAAMAGRGPMPMNPADFDSVRFGLVSGGYYEAEVDAALRQVKDILRRR